jgi:ribosomal protein L7/L12
MNHRDTFALLLTVARIGSTEDILKVYNLASKLADPAPEMISGVLTFNAGPRKIEVIKAYREWTGRPEFVGRWGNAPYSNIGLKDAKDAIDAGRIEYKAITRAQLKTLEKGLATAGASIWVDDIPF